ncbi:MAG TPA: VCBS repeat-containing protein [Phycisphaerales bacterium]|nr:VCBS repeat-containing protein [Phycisphaerales bacterium]
MKRSPMVLSLLAGLALAQAAHGQFSLSGPTNYATPDRPAGVASGDFNGDGALDLAVTTDNLDKVSVLINSGDGAFAAPVNFLTGSASGPGSIVAADFIGGPQVDLAIALQNTSSVLLMQGDGAGGFAAVVVAQVGANPRGMAAGDFNEDGLLDLTVANRDSNTISVLLNNGAGFTVASLGAGAEPRDAAAGDFNNDGNIDLVVTNHDDRTISVFNGNGSGGFTAGGALSVGGNVSPEGATSADLDGDGDTDLAVATGDPSFAAVFINSNGLSGPFNYGSGGLGAGDIAAGDLDGDGDVDLAVIHEDSNDMGLLANQGNGAFGAPQMFALGANPSAIVIADLGATTASDIAVANRDSNNTSVFINQAAGGCPADFNGDGVVDTRDVLAFLNAWNANEPASDCNADAVIDTRDVLCFLNLWNAGC